MSSQEADSKLKAEFDAVVEALVDSVNSKASETIYGATEGIQHAAQNINKAGDNVQETANKIRNSLQTISNIERSFRQDCYNINQQHESLKATIFQRMQKHEANLESLTKATATSFDMVNNKLTWMFILSLSVNVIGFLALCFLLL